MEKWTECFDCHGDLSPASTCSSPTMYAKRDLEQLGKYYFRHLNAMTAEKLHSKSDIAAELAVRDAIIDGLLGKNQPDRNP